jgi:hypothetical protein
MPDEEPPGDAFARLGNETRVAILRTLYDSWSEAGFAADYAVPFTDIQEAVGSEDSGRFNYHLQQLTGRFVRKTDEGYIFTHEGWRIVRTMQDVTGDAADPEERELPSTCYNCGHDTLVARYVHEWVWLDCPACGQHVCNIEAPPGVMNLDDTATLVAALDRRNRRRSKLMVDGVCPDCFGDTKRTIEPHSWGPDEFCRYVHHCEFCDRSFLPPLGWYVLDRSLVRAFYSEHDTDLDKSPYWEIGTLTNGPNAFEDVRDRDPWRLTVRFPAGNEELVVVLDENASVVEVSRRS